MGDFSKNRKFLCHIIHEICRKGNWEQVFPGISILAEILSLCYNEGYPPNQRGAHPFEKERKESVTIQRLEREEAHRLYLARFREDFVPSELRPWGSILRLMDQGAYAIFACKEAGEILAYATFIQCSGALLLDYFAVDPARRGQGVGTAFFHGLQKLPALGQAPCLYIEAESLESAPTPQERETRRRRIQFYTRCGCVESPWYAYLFGVEYRILLLPLEEPLPGEEQMREQLLSVYNVTVPMHTDGTQEGFHRVCRVYRREGI